ncbi:hypothetical protein FHL15_006517 [Xylaria flabelliformis]|uniref:J domain-containing protein n=1 Tax=Xylaria flabelliformis TaxID=2512241 RepID=A0A553HXB8_9PEZI|nr:hypothetical protein FHL15_006517 [Xylaria flabelliformis]
MPIKESARILSSCPNLLVPGACSPVSCTTSCSCIGPKRVHRGRPTSLPNRGALSSKLNHASARCYASVSGPPPSKRSSGAAAGYTWPTSLHPTPYEILAHPRDTQYSKALFYELVKIYHPDRNPAAAHSSIPHSVRLERYRLVVAANEILSDSAKRRAYDLYGAGWDGNRTLQNLYREADRSWRSKPGNASRNATWEDWERWRHERDGEKPPQTPLFMSNELFVVVLCSFVVVGSFAQARRASNSTLNVIEMRDQKHAAISDSIQQRQNDQASLNRQERVESFLRQRDSWKLVSSRDRGPEPPP